MNGELPSDKTVAALQDHLGEPFVVRHLHPWHVRFRRVYAQKSLALPSALLLKTASGKVYKLHISDKQRRIVHMLNRAEQARDTGLFPEVLWQNDEAILLEFIPGRRPSFKGEEFARALGKAMAMLHAHDVRDVDEKRVGAGVARDLALLAESNVLRGNSAQYEEQLSQARRDNLKSSMDYADVKPGNFLRDKTGRLRFIDLGALRANRPAGQYLCGSFYLRQLNREAFAEAYLSAGGLQQVIEQARYLRMLNCIWGAALYVRKMQEVPIYLPIHKLSYRLLAGHLLREFRQLSKLTQNDFRMI